MTDPEYGEFPLKTHLGMVIEGAGDGATVASIDVGPEHRNPNDVVHGAVLFAMVDTAMGKAALSVLDDGQFCSTVDLQLRFVRPVSSGRVEATATVLKRGRTVIHLEGRVVDESGRLVATAGSTFAIIGI